MKNLPLNPKAELFRWGPIPGRPIYVSYFMESIAKRTHKLYKYKWPRFLFCFIGGKMSFICENHKLVAQGKKYFDNWVMKDKMFVLVKKRYATAANQLTRVENKVKNLNKLSDSQLKNLYLDFHEKYLTFWDHGLVPEIANWGGEAILKESLKKIPAGEFVQVYEKLSAPCGLSFYKKEELDLLRVSHGSANLSEHVKKYFWINNSYLDSTVLTKDFFLERLTGIKKADAGDEIKKISSFVQDSERTRRECVRKYNLSSKVDKISSRLGYCIYWQDDRKGKILHTNHYIKLFLEEFGRRYGYPLSHLEQYWCWELPDLLNGRKVSAEEVESRLEQQAGYMVAEEEKNEVITSKEFDARVKPFLETKADDRVKVIKGLSVSLGSGIVRGRVKILMNPRDFNKMRNNDILLAPMTSPEYILALRKAAAVITDVGGMTCHAAIVSRELGIPCIVGTKIATKVFKDGDLVEVDANRGVVKKL